MKQARQTREREAMAREGMTREAMTREAAASYGPSVAIDAACAEQNSESYTERGHKPHAVPESALSRTTGAPSEVASSPAARPSSYAGPPPDQSLYGPPGRENVIYTYDGSLNGFYCCVYESYYLRETPVSVTSVAGAQPSFMRSKMIVTDREKARKVKSAIEEKISDEALDLIETVFLSCLEQKELRSLRFLVLAFREGGKALRMLGHPDVAPLMEAEKHLLKEAHLLKGFVRFSDIDGVLTSNITPKNFILPFIANHFCARYAEERFIIYDKTHKAGLFYQNQRRYIARLEEMPFPEADEKETRYQELWKRFYHTIAIEARINPRCRMTHMPKRYWSNMTEMAELL